MQQEWASTLELVSKFEFETALCFDPHDRPVVEKNISAFMICGGYADADGDKHQALLSFNRFVQNFVPQIMKASCGDTPIAFPHMILCMCCLNLTMGLDSFSGLVVLHGVTHIQAWGYLLVVVTTSMSCVPLAMEFSTRLMGMARDLSGWREVVWVFFGTVILFGGGGGLDRFNMALHVRAESSLIALVMFLVYNAVWIGVAIAFECHRRKKHFDLRNKLDAQTPLERMGLSQARMGDQDARQRANEWNVDVIVDAPGVNSLEVDGKPVCEPEVRLSGCKEAIIPEEDSTTIASNSILRGGRFSL
jgi:hypothetical protein